MNPARLLAHFDCLAEAPDAIPRLRQFILELAVRGKLVDRDPRDEPVTELLKRIQAAKEKRIKEGQVKKQEPLLRVRPSEARFVIPASWCWVRLGTITQIIMGQSPPGETYNKTGKGIPLINGPVEFTEGPFGITVVNQYTTAPTNLCEEGDLLLCVRGSTTGRTNIAGFRACIGRGVAAIRPFFADQYVRLFIWRLRASIIAMGRGIAFPSVSRQQIEELPVPLPPLAEQHCIVAKVDDLMALCDRLEAAQAERENRRDRLSAASLHCLDNGAGADVFLHHARFYFNQLPRLTTRPVHIQQLRQTILNLAVSGKLVPQDPNDESASELLKRIQAERARLVKAGEKKKEPLPEFSHVDRPFELPHGWCWVRFGEIYSLEYGDNLPAEKRSNSGEYPVYGSNGIVGSHSVCFVREPCIVVGRKGSAGALNLSVTEGCCVTDVAYYCIPPRELDLRFSFKLFHTLGLDTLGKGIKPGLNRNEAYVLPLALPPLAEQHRIVAKVEELMSRCDRLEAQLTTSQTESRRLLEAILHEALMPVAV